MKTTGTVLLNARGMNINGYDCFVNLSKANKNNKTTYRINQWTDITPIAGYQTFVKVDPINTKISKCSFSAQNMYYCDILFTSYETSVPNSFTIAMWRKWDNFFNQSTANTKHQYIQEHYNGTYITGLGANISYFWNNTRKAIAYLNSDTHNWDHTSISTNYSSGWHHYAITKLNNTLYLFIDGQRIWTATSSSFSNYRFLRFGELAQTFYVDDAVVISGQALWTSNFTVPSSYLLDDEYSLDTQGIQRKNIIVSNVSKGLIIPEIDTLKIY